MLLLGWLLPLLAISFSLLYLVSSMVSGQIEKTISVSTDNAVKICEMQMAEVIAASKSASYLPTIKDSYSQYQRDGNKQELYSVVTGFLNEQYKYNPSSLCTMMYFFDDPNEIFYTYNTYKDNNMGTNGYARVQFFQEYVQGSVLAESEELDTGMALKVIDGHVYQVRNLVNAMFEPYGMIVMELEPTTIFESLKSIWGAERYEIYVDGQPIFGTEIGDEFNMDKLNFVNEQSVYLHTPNRAYVYHVLREENQTIAYLVELNVRTIIDDLFMIRYLFILVIIFTIPLVFMILKFFYTKVSKPISKLVDAATEIALGNYGLEVEGVNTSEEFQSLDRAFNTMSRELKYQFEKIYLEELALKDANIMALQSQINPHFLNNTLEIINWEARMNGNENVSAMIEALATMLSATMNRKQKRYVKLSEELTYVDAYLYIIGRRYGDRFQVKRQIDEKLMDVLVPLLIIQPIVENAVEHGVANRRSGVVEMRIYSKGDRMYIEVINDGTLSEADKEKITYLLGGKVRETEEKHVSLGIRNVNRRLKIIYGESYGLTIRGEGEKTISTLVVGKNKEGQD